MSTMASPTSTSQYSTSPSPSTDLDSTSRSPQPRGSSTSKKRTRIPQPTVPYSTHRVNLYSASSSLLTIDGEPIPPSTTTTTTTTSSKPPTSTPIVLPPSYAKRSTAPASADEILFHQYPSFRLPPSVETLLSNQDITSQLPSSDLLKSLHAYTSDFYASRGWQEVGFRSMDEGALIAMGVLMEEMCRECLGKDGDLVFRERREVDLLDDENEEGEVDGGDQDIS